MIPCLDSFHVLHHKGFTFYRLHDFLLSGTRPGLDMFICMERQKEKNELIYNA